MSAKEFDTQNGQYPSLNLELSSDQAVIEGEILENLRLLVGRIQKSGQFPRTLAITSALSGEGVTSVCLGLGAVLAHDYQAEVCIVDLNWYSPSDLLPEPARTGTAAEVLEGNLPLEQALAATGVQLMKLLPAGRLDYSRRPVLARSTELTELLKALAIKFDHLILDVPALLTTSDAAYLAGQAEACLLVVRQGVTPIPVIKKSLDEISHLPVLGVVLNQTRQASPRFLLRLLET